MIQPICKMQSCCIVKDFLCYCCFLNKVCRHGETISLQPRTHFLSMTLSLLHVVVAQGGRM